jgi:hypothetical protein
MLLDGSKVDGMVTLRQALLRRPQVIVGTMTEKLFTYALGRGISAADMPAVRSIVRGSANDGYKFSSIVAGIVANPAFQMRIKAAAGGEPALTTASR